VLDPTWSRLLRTGCIAGGWAIEGPDGGHLDTVYCALSDALQGVHVVAFAPAGWTAAEFGLDDDEASAPEKHLTPRELDILQLAALGLSGQQIADELVVSTATVKTHFTNTYAKLNVGDRVAAVATGMRLGLID
jgi:DNA-binding NarL/FixJ family response regulator